MSDRRAEIARRIAENVDIKDAGYETPCWLWTMADSGNGRGKPPRQRKAGAS